MIRFRSKSHLSMSLCALTLAFLSSLVFSDITLSAKKPLWSLDGFSEPESMLLDPERDRIIVSNIDGHPGEADGRGFLSLVAPSGSLIERHWVDGLNAPKGMAFVDGKLLIADLTQLVVIDPEKGLITQRIEVDKAIFLNDITADANTAWITDFLGNAIYQYQDGKVSLWLQDNDLNYPNGIFFDKDALLVGTWGAGLNNDFTTNQPGGLLSIAISDKTISPVPGAETLGNIDGVFRQQAHIFANDWGTGELFAIDANGQVSVLASLSAGLADIASGENNVVMTPFMHEGVIKAYSLLQ